MVGAEGAFEFGYRECGEVTVRKAREGDIDAVERIYDAIHAEEESGKLVTGWIRGVYPVRETAEKALERGDLFVMEEAGGIVGAAVINKAQVDVYSLGSWMHEAPDDEVCVLHTLVISPAEAGKGYGRAFVDFYESYALENGCTELRMDTNARNTAARAMYGKLGYTEIGTVPTVFNGIPNVQLVLLEKNKK